jgi:hypothetical protein
MRGIFFFAAFFLFCTTLTAQQTDVLKGKDLQDVIYASNHFSFGIGAHLTQKAKTKKTSGPYKIDSQTQGGFEAGLNYHINFRNKPYSLIIGLHGAASARNYTLFIPRDDFSQPRQDDYVDNGALTRAFDMYISAPVLFEKRWMSHKKNLWTLNAGIALCFYPDEIYENWSSYIEDGNGGYTELYNMDLLVSNDFKPWLNYLVTVGHAWTLRNYNMFRVNLQACYSSFSITKGDYKVTVPGQPC